MKSKKKQQYKLKNWSNYNQALTNRGSLAIWIDESMVEQWSIPKKVDIEAAQ